MALVHAGNNGNLRPPPPPPASAPGGCLRRDYQGTTTKMTSNKSNHLFPHCNNRACLMLQRQRKPFSLGWTRLRLVSGNNQRHRHAERTATTGTKCATCFMCGAQRLVVHVQSMYINACGTRVHADAHTAETRRDKHQNGDPPRHGTTHKA